MPIAQVAIGVQVSGFPQMRTVRSDQDGVEPKLWLCAQGTAWHIMPFARVADHETNFEIASGARFYVEEWAIDATTVL